MQARIVFIALLMLSWAGMANAKQNIYTNQIRQEEGANAFYMDRNGDLYPPASVTLNTFYMLNVKNGLRSYEPPSSPAWATLKGLYKWKASLDPASAEGREWVALLEHAAVASHGDFEEQWTRVQGILRERLAEQISTLGKDGEVVLLVHGYNNSHGTARGWYSKLEQGLAKARAGSARPPVFVRMYWDGLEGKTPFAIWTKAQFNGYLVGVELRTVLNKIAPDTPLRVITHSSGAFVITNALGDASVSADPKAMPAYYYDRARGRENGYTPPKELKNLHVAMLIPAQPMTAFASYIRDKNPDGRWVPADAKVAAIPRRLVLGLSKRDSATSKTLLAPCKFLGDTCMAVRVENTCSQVAYDLQIGRDQLQMVNFIQPFLHGHGVEKYTDDPEWSDFVTSLFDLDAPEPLGSLTYCPAAARDRN